jgi:hypothetical protein
MRWARWRRHRPCCGLSGRAYARSRCTLNGDELRLRGAELGVACASPRMLDTPFAHSLYKGAVGPVVLAEEP